MCSTPSILVRCDGSPEIGLGHVVRCLALADELREGHGLPVAFAMRQGPLGMAMVREKDYPVFKLPDEEAYEQAGWLKTVVASIGARALILDVRDNVPRAAVETLRKQGVLIVTIDDPSDRRLTAGLAFYPPVPQVQRLDWAGFAGQLYVGWEWVVLRREFAQRPSRVPNECPVVLVTMGGSDPAGLTLKAVEALDLLDEDFETVVALGPGFCHHEALRDLLARTRRPFDVRQNVSDMPSLMAQADLAVASFGVTAYELAAMSVPAIYLCLTEGHAESASAFVGAGMAICLGVFTQVSEPVLAEAVRQLLYDASRRSWMAGRAGKLVDGQGAERIASMVATKVKSAYA